MRNLSIFFEISRSRHPLFLAWLLGGGVEALVPFGQVLVSAVTYRRTSVPEAKKEEQEQQVVLSWPSSSATTTVVVANGDPPFRKVTGLAVRSKVVCHCCGADRFTTSAPLSDIAGLASIFRISHREEVCVPPATTRMEPNHRLLGAFRGIGLTTSTPRFWHAIVLIL